MCVLYTTNPGLTNIRRHKIEINTFNYRANLRHLKAAEAACTPGVYQQFKLPFGLIHLNNLSPFRSVPLTTSSLLRPLPEA